MRHSLAMNSRITIPILMILIVGALLFSPVHAYTVGNNICSGIEYSSYAFDFSVLPDSVGVYDVGNPELTYNETVNNTYHYGINDTAWHYGGYGSADDGIQITFSNFDNSSYGFNIDSIYFDFYNYSMNGLSLFEVVLFYDDYENDIRYFLVYYPDFDIISNSGDHSTVKFVSNQYSYWEKFNLTTMELIDAYFWESEIHQKDWELQNFNMLLMNIPPDYIQNDDWNVNITFDNMIVAQEENEYNSPDCALVLDNMSGIGVDFTLKNKYVNITGIILNTESHIDYMKFIYARGLDSITGFYISDSSTSRFVSLPVDLLNYLGDKDMSLRGHLVSVVGYLEGILQGFPLGLGYPYISGINKFAELGISEEAPLVRTIPSFITDSPEAFGDSNILSKERVFEEDKYPIWKYEFVNSTTGVRTDISTNTTTYYELNETRVSEVGDLETYRLLFYPLPLAYTFYSGELSYLERLTNSDYYDVVMIGDGFNKQCESVDPELCYSGLTFPFSDFDIIGDGICGDLESSVPSSWNYDPQCELDKYGLTGYAVTQTNILVTGVVIIMFLLGSILVLLSDAGWDVKATMIFFLIAIAVVAGAIISNYP